MANYQENFIYTTCFIKKLLKIKMVTLLLGHPVLMINVESTHHIGEESTIFCYLRAEFMDIKHFQCFMPRME